MMKTTLAAWLTIGVLSACAVVPQTPTAAAPAANRPDAPAANRADTPAAPTVPLPADTRIVRDVVYKTVNGRDLKLDLYLPAQSHANKPLLVWVHGGAWRRGNKADVANRNSRLLSELLNNGYAVASISYRLSGEATFPAPIQDVNDAVHFLARQAEQYGWRADNIMLGGRSAGGHLSALAAMPATAPRDLASTERPAALRIKAAAVFFGIYDLIALGQQKNNPQGGSETAFLGASPATVPDTARLASPLSHIGRHSPPMLIMHGTADRTVPHAQSEMLHRALNQAGVVNELHLIEGAQHGDSVFDNEINVQRTIRFLNLHR